MMTLFNDIDLFNSGELKIQNFVIPDAELKLYEHFFPRAIADDYYGRLLNETPWKQEPITIYDKTHPTPRLTAWYGLRKGNESPNELTETLLGIKQKVEGECEMRFQSILLNLYRDGQDHVSWHRDHDREYIKNPTIASVTFGETRVFQVRHKFNKQLKRIDIPLNHGSLLVMGGSMQDNWEHQIPKTTKVFAPRINLTFRVV